MKNDLTILRYESGPSGTFGIALHGSRWLCYTLEPADRSGRFRCAIKAGRWPLAIEWSPHFRAYLPSITVPGRSGLRIHAGNVVTDTAGCILVGEARIYNQVTNSRRELSALIDYIKEQHITHINIIDYETISC